MERIADVTVVKQDIVWLRRDGSSYLNPTSIYLGEKGHIDYGSNPGSDNFRLGVRFTIEVTPKNGDPVSTIIKTFELEEERIEE